MVDTRLGGVYGILLGAVLLCGLPYAYPVTRGQRVRSSPDIPLTQFTCSGRPPGYYADLETGCQVYHMCTEGGNQFSYKCPNTTLFQQRMLICAHWYQVNCSRSELHYGANLLIGQRDKPFVNDDPVHLNVKQVKTLQNPDVLQNIGQSSRENTARQAKSQTSNENVQANRAFQNNFKRDEATHVKFSGKSTPFSNPSSTTTSPQSNGRTPVDLSMLPLAGSVLPGGFKNFQFSHPPQQGVTFNTQTFPSTSVPRQNISPRVQFTNIGSTPTPKATQAISFASPTSTQNSLDRVNFFATTKSPVGFTSKFFTETPNKFQPNGFKGQPLPDNVFEHDTSTSEPSFEFLPPSDQNQSTDLTVASQENAVSSRRSTTPPPSLEGNLPETDVKAEIQQTKNGSFPDDRFNTFLKRFNPYEQPPLPTVIAKPEETTTSEPEYHTFINRFVPEEVSSNPESNLREEPEHNVFIDRFVLTPEELKMDKDRKQVDKLHNLLPPDDRLTVSFPNFDLMPPTDDSDDSESNRIELHLQDPRSTFFIPSGDGNDFSKADAAPIVVSIPLHSHQKAPPMWFRTNVSDDKCARCHPSFIVNKDTCMPCVVIR